jgi:hypothetical protein
METPETLINRELGAGERLLWSGRPRQGITCRRSDLLMVPFSLMWGGFAFFWEYSAWSTGNAPLFFLLWGIPFVLVGIYIIVGRFIIDAKQRERTVYGVTSERVVIVSGLFTRRVKSLNIRTLSEVDLDERADGSGTITFGQTNVFSAWGTGTSWPGMPQMPSLEMIPEARTVYEAIRKAQRSSV